MKIFKLIALLGVVLFSSACTTPDGYLVWDEKSQELGRKANSDCGYLPVSRKNIGRHICVKEDRQWVLSKLMSYYVKNRAQYEYLYDVEDCKKDVKARRNPGQSPSLTCVNRVKNGHRNSNTNEWWNDRTNLIYVSIGSCQAEITNIVGYSGDMDGYDDQKNSGLKIRANRWNSSLGTFNSETTEVSVHEVIRFDIQFINRKGVRIFYQPQRSKDLAFNGRPGRRDVTKINISDFLSRDPTVREHVSHHCLIN